MKKYIKNQRGITLIALIVTIIIIAILVGVTVRYANIGTDVRNYNYMCADIELLENKIKLFYNDKGTIPTVGSVINAKSFLGTQANTKDNDNYYKVDVSQLYNVTLNYGGGADENDAYIINEQSLKVYYLKGVVLDNVKYYTKKAETKRIYFTINGEKYYAEQGMTWKDWVNSNYNTAEFVIATYKNVKRVFFKSGDYYVSDTLGLTEVTEDSEIVENQVYGRTKTDSGDSLM